MDGLEARGAGAPQECQALASHSQRSASKTVSAYATPNRWAFPAARRLIARVSRRTHGVGLGSLRTRPLALEATACGLTSRTLQSFSRAHAVWVSSRAAEVSQASLGPECGQPGAQLLQTLRSFQGPSRCRTSVLWGQGRTPETRVWRCLWHPHPSCSDKTCATLTLPEDNGDRALASVCPVPVLSLSARFTFPWTLRPQREGHLSSDTQPDAAFSPGWAGGRTGAQSLRSSRLGEEAGLRTGTAANPKD